MQVRFNDTSDVVMVEVAISGLTTWRYVYTDQGKQYINTSISGASPVHALELPEQLEGHFNVWDVQMANTTAEDQQYRIIVRWTQGGAPLAEWRADGSLQPGASKVEQGNAFFSN